MQSKYAPSCANSSFSDQGSTVERFEWTKLPVKAPAEQAEEVSAAVPEVDMVTKVKGVVELPAATVLDTVRRLMFLKK